MGLVLDGGKTKYEAIHVPTGAVYTTRTPHYRMRGERPSLRRSHLAVDHVKVLVGKVCEDGIDVLLLRKRRNKFTIGARRQRHVSA